MRTRSAFSNRVPGATTKSITTPPASLSFAPSPIFPFQFAAAAVHVHAAFVKCTVNAVVGVVYPATFACPAASVPDRFHVATSTLFATATIDQFVRSTAPGPAL